VSESTVSEAQETLVSADADADADADAYGDVSMAGDADDWLAQGITVGELEERDGSPSDEEEGDVRSVLCETESDVPTAALGEAVWLPAVGSAVSDLGDLGDLGEVGDVCDVGEVGAV